MAFVNGNASSLCCVLFMNAYVNMFYFIVNPIYIQPFVYTNLAISVS